MSNFFNGGKDVAIEIRKILKQTYPKTKFSVISDYSRVLIKYNFGVSQKEIEKLVSKFLLGHYDSQEEYYKNDNRDDSIPQCEYIFIERRESWNEIQKLAKYVSKEFNVEFNANVRFMIGYRWLDCLNDIEIFENENVEAMYNRVRTEAIRQGLLCVCDTIPVETSSETKVKPEVETKECQCPKCGNINIVETQWLNMLCMKCDYDTDNDDTVKFINGEIIKNETQEVKTSSETEVKASKWEKLNKEFDEKLNSISDDEMSNWIDKNKESNMSIENVVDAIKENITDLIKEGYEVEVEVKCPSCGCRHNVYEFGVTSFKCERCGVIHNLDKDGLTIVDNNITDTSTEKQNVIGCDIEDDIQADEICYNTNEIAPQVVVQCPNCYANNSIITSVKSFVCVKCGLTHEVYEHNGEIRVLNITDENVNISNNNYNTKVEFKDYKNGYIISGTTDIDLVKQKLNESNLNRYVKIGVEYQLSDISESRSVKFENHVQCFVECGGLIEALDVVSQKRFIEMIQNEKIEIGDIICLLQDTVIIISEKRNCIILL